MRLRQKAYKSQKYQCKVGKVGNNAATPPRFGSCMQHCGRERAVPPGRLYSPLCTPETKSGIGPHTLSYPNVPSSVLEAVANSGPGQGGWNSSFVGDIIRPAAYFFLDRRGLAIVLMVRMFAFEVEKALHLISRLRSRRHPANWRPCYLVEDPAMRTKTCRRQI